MLNQLSGAKLDTDYVNALIGKKRSGRAGTFVPTVEGMANSLLCTNKLGVKKTVRTTQHK